MPSWIGRGWAALQDGRFSAWAGSLLFALGAGYFMLAVAVPAGGRLTHGFSAYYVAARLAATGDISAAIYDPAYFRPLVQKASGGQADDIFNANPPTTALLFGPLSGLSIETARFVWNWTNVLLLLGGQWLLVRRFAPDRQREMTPVVWLLALFFQPVIQNFRFGQAYVLVFLLLTVIVIAFRQRTAVWGGAALAAALLLKLSGGPLLLYLLWQRRWRYLLWTAVISAVVVLLTLPLFPPDMWLAFRQLLAETGQSPTVCVTAYQTTRSLLCHLLTVQPGWNERPVVDLPWLALSLWLALAAATLLLTFWFGRRRPVDGLTAMVAWTVLFAPLGEQHHHVIMLIPLTWLILQGANGRLGQTAVQLLLPAALALYLVPFPLNHSALQAGWRAVLAYPRLYAAWLTWLAVILTFQRLEAGAQNLVGGADNDKGLLVDSGDNSF